MQAYYTVHCKMEDNACKLTIRYIVKWRICVCVVKIVCLEPEHATYFLYCTDLCLFIDTRHLLPDCRILCFCYLCISYTNNMSQRLAR